MKRLLRKLKELKHSIFFKRKELEAQLDEYIRNKRGSENTTETKEETL